MRNLYKRLNSDRWAPQETLNRSINNCRDKSLQQDAECVFSNPKSRKLYDHTHAALTGISQLRNGLGLTHKELWDDQLNAEFNDGKTLPLRFHRLTKGNSINLGIKQVVIMLLIVFGVIAFIPQVNTSDSTSRSTPAAQISKYPPQIQIPIKTFNEPVATTPAHGGILRYHAVEAVAPLEIKTSSGGYYFIKLVNATTGQDAVELFIHGGRTIEIDMPLGSYIMKYASGQTWYGREHFFGPNTSYSKASSSFHFTKDYSGYSGYTVTLYKVTNGNLQTKSISASQF